MTVILLALQEMSDEWRPVREKNIMMIHRYMKYMPRKSDFHCQQCSAASETDLHITESKNMYHLRCRKGELVLQKAGLHKQPIKHFRRGFTVLENLEDMCFLQLPTWSYCNFTPVKRCPFHVLVSGQACAWPRLTTARDKSLLHCLNKKTL